MTEVPTLRLDALPHPVPDDVQFVDVREDNEWTHGHIQGATHIPLSELPQRVDEVPEGLTIFVCKVGGRSAQAVGWLVQQGYEAVNLDGGMLDWDAAGRPMVSETDADPFVVV